MVLGAIEPDFFHTPGQSSLFQANGIFTQQSIHGRPLLLYQERLAAPNKREVASITETCPKFKWICAFNPVGALPVRGDAPDNAPYKAELNDKEGLLWNQVG